MWVMATADMKLCKPEYEVGIISLEEEFGE